jgi:flagellar biosynthetic protein FliQ
VESFEGLLREMMVIAAMLCVPVLAVAAAVGTVVAIVQAATQVQEQTLTLLPKVIAVGLMAALFGRFGMQLCAQLFHDAILAIPALVSGT